MEKHPEDMAEQAPHPLSIVDYGISRHVIERHWYLNYFRVVCIGNSAIKGAFASVESAYTLALPEPSLWGVASLATMIAGAAIWYAMAKMD